MDRDPRPGEHLGPIFVGGASRSGKTLMRWILSSHPRIAVTRRTEMWPRYYRRFGDLARSDNLERCLATMLARPQIAALGPDVGRLRRDFRTGESTYARLFALVHEQYLQRCGKVRWGDQTGWIERFADALMSAYPDARVIHMIRDPRDRHEAVLERSARRPGAVGRTTATWSCSIALAERNLARYPGSYAIVRYEDLVTRPGETVRTICAFVGERFEPTMLKMEGARRYERGPRDRNGPISSAYVGRYRKQVEPSDVAFIQTVAGRRMCALGYDPDPVGLNTRARLRCLGLDWPLSLARLASSSAHEAIGARARAFTGTVGSGR